jgi:hypothetical protein
VSSDTGGLCNADYIYSQCSKLYAGVDLPDLKSPSRNTVKALIFVSGSKQGGYGAFHIEGATPSDFDRIVVDSLDAAGNYSPGSGLASAALTPTAVKADRLFAPHRGVSGLLGIVDEEDVRLKSAKSAEIASALKFAEQSVSALKTAVKTRNNSAVPQPSTYRHSEHADTVLRLVHANETILRLTAQAAAAAGGRTHLSTALFAAEVVESFEAITGKGAAGKTDGEGVSRVLAFKLAPEIALVPGFNSGVTQQWWQDGHPDFANDNSQNDQSTDGNAAGVMFLLFLTDFLGVSISKILAAMPATNGAPLGKTYEALVAADPSLKGVGGANGTSAFHAMINLLTQNTQSANGTLNLPADGNPFPSMPNSKQGGL